MDTRLIEPEIDKVFFRDIPEWSCRIRVISKTIIIEVPLEGGLVPFIVVRDRCIWIASVTRWSTDSDIINEPTYMIICIKIFVERKADRYG